MRRSIQALVFGTAALLLTAAPAGAQRTPQKVALLIGISNYEPYGGVSSINVPTLQYADEDVAELRRTLERQNWVVEPLVDRAATRDQIIGALAGYSRTLQEDDTFLIYFAGHGVKSVGKHTYWLAYDTNPGLLDVHGIRLSHLLDIIADLPPKMKIVLLDHCYSGNIEFTSSALTAADVPAGGARGTAGEPGVAAVHLNAATDASREILPDDVQQSMPALAKHMVLIAAASGPAYESAEFQHGVFTYYLSQALNTREADVDGPPDLQLTLRELVDYLAKQLDAYGTRKHLTQTPFVPPPAGENLVTYGKLKLFSLPQDVNRRPAMRDYLAKLAAWAQPDRNWVMTDTLNQFSEVLGRWSDNLVLTREETALIEALRSAIDGNVPPQERTRATSLEAIAAAARDRVRSPP